MPPPRVRFADTVWHAEQAFAATAIEKVKAMSGAGAVDDDVTLMSSYAELDRRVRQFRDAEYAARRGLSLDTFA